MQPDAETKEILTEQQELKGLVAGRGWGIARAKLTEKITDLQNAFNIEETTPEKMLIDLQARKQATMILFDWLRDIEGTAASADENIPLVDKSYIFKV